MTMCIAGKQSIRPIPMRLICNPSNFQTRPKPKLMGILVELPCRQLTVQLSRSISHTNHAERVRNQRLKLQLALRCRRGIRVCE